MLLEAPCASGGWLPWAAGRSRQDMPAWEAPWGGRETPFLPLLPPCLHSASSSSEDSGEDKGPLLDLLLLAPKLDPPWARLSTFRARALSLSKSLLEEMPTTSTSEPTEADGLLW